MLPVQGPALGFRAQSCDPVVGAVQPAAGSFAWPAALLLRFSRRGALLLSWRQDEAGLGDEAVQETRTVL
ncbi:hypothetical protein ACFYRD_35035, partial [Streptomyces hirsutus]|uniref:hypothetical protein n=1 Tax=Streptomyces hirsutus TaxID=35620 RepID=UPI0036CB3A36